MLLLLRGVTGGAPPSVVAETTIPTPEMSVAWASDPLDPPVYSDVSAYLRSVSTSRGRSYEYDRSETGVASYTLSNRDSRFDPDNAAGPYFPNVKPTRRTQINAVFDTVSYPVIQAFSEGYPNEFPGDGYDAVVQQNASDWFYPLNAFRFPTPITSLAIAIETIPDAGTEEVIAVDSVLLPMPQAYPFIIQIGTGNDLERMEVIGTPPGLLGTRRYTVRRGYQDSTITTHPAGVEIKAEEFKFAQEQSGVRINHCLDLMGIATADRDIDAGNTLIAASDNLIGVSLLEHLLLVAECENGRLFASRSGKITFRERHWQYVTETSARETFGPGAGEIPYLSGTGNVLAHEDAKLFNRVRITLPTGKIVEASDQASIDAHFERVLDKQWPLADANEAQDAADYMLSRLKQAQLRLPKIRLRPRGTSQWTKVLPIELAQRHRLKLDPPVGSTVIDTEVIVERIAHQTIPGDWTVAFEFSEADTTLYWRVEMVGQSELDSTTLLAY